MSQASLVQKLSFPETTLGGVIGGVFSAHVSVEPGGDPTLCEWTAPTQKPLLMKMVCKVPKPDMETACWFLVLILIVIKYT